MSRLIPLGQRELLQELADEPRPEEAWHAEENFDPPFRRSDIVGAERAGRVEVDRSRAACWRFRLTPKGRDQWEARQNSSDGEAA